MPASASVGGAMAAPCQRPTTARAEVGSANKQGLPGQPGSSYVGTLPVPPDITREEFCVWGSTVAPAPEARPSHKDSTRATVGSTKGGGPVIGGPSSGKK